MELSKQPCMNLTFSMSMWDNGWERERGKSEQGMAISASFSCQVFWRICLLLFIINWRYVGFGFWKLRHLFFDSILILFLKPIFISWQPLSLQNQVICLSVLPFFLPSIRPSVLPSLPPSLLSEEPSLLCLLFF